MNPITDEMCRWDAPGFGSILLSASTVRDLRAKAIHAFLSLPRRGVEIGGLLFGDDRPGQPSIQGFEEIACEHRYGPSFLLSDEDRARLAGQLAQPRRSNSSAPIGFYRSYTGRSPEIEDSDIAFLQEHFPKGQCVILLLQPVNAQTCTAGFRLCQDGELLPEPPYEPVPFDPAYWNADAAIEPEPRPAPQAAIPAEPPELPVPPAPQRSRVLPPPYRAAPPQAIAHRPPPPEPRSRTRWWMPVLLCLVLGIGGAAIYELWTLSGHPRWAELYLDAKPSPDSKSLLITWDPAVSRSVGATHALLGVNDGAVRRDIPLTPAQLQLGRYLYTPENPELELRLILYGNGPAVSGGALRFVAPPHVEPAPPAASAPSPASPEPAPASEPEPKAVPPRTAIRQVQPSIPAGIRARLSGNVEIPVTVRVNPRGLVTSASTPQVANGLRRYLGQEAVKAARLWRFAPARIASEKTVYFTFAP